VDGMAASFTEFINVYAHQLGRRKPKRIPTFMVRFLPFVITPQQVSLLNLSAAELGFAKALDLLGWSPDFPNFHEGLKDTVQS